MDSNIRRRNHNSQQKKLNEEEKTKNYTGRRIFILGSEEPGYRKNSSSHCTMSVTSSRDREA